MNKKSLRLPGFSFFSALAFGVLVIVLGGPAAQALTLSPPAIEFSVVPGNQAEFVVKLYNEGTEKQQLFAEATTFTASADEGIPAYDFTAPKEDIATWLKFDTAPIVLEPQGRKEVIVTVNVPADAPPGGHYGVVAFSTTPASGANKPQVSIAQGVGTLLLVRIEGDVKESAMVTAFGITAGRSNRLPLTFTTAYKNTGNIHLKPTGTVTITDMFKRSAVTLTVNQTKASTLPQSTRNYSVLWEKSTAQTTAGNAWAAFWQEYRNERSNFAFGKYMATLALTAGQSNGVVTSATTTFWVFPWHVVLVWAVVLVLILLLLILLVKRYNHWVIAKAQSGNNQNPPAGTA